MQTVAAQISRKYQVVIPKVVRQALGVQPNDTLLFLLDGDTVILRVRPANFTQILQGLHKEIWPDPDAWLEAERSTWEA
jgi:AbrB family looped-hinge helix DNA binding protein